MEEKTVEKSRKQRRKEARLAKGKRKLDSWVNHHQSTKSRNSISKTKTTPVIENIENEVRAAEKEVRVSAGGSGERKKKVKSKKSAKSKKPKTKFAELIEMEKGRGDLLAEKDLITEKKLAKKLKVKGGKLWGDDDDLSLLLEGIPSVEDSEDASLSDEGVSDEDASLSDEGVSDEDASLSDEGVSDEEVQYEMDAFSSEDEDSDMLHSSSEEECDRAQELVAPVGSKREKKRTRKTNFEDMEGMQRGDFAASEDIELERKPAKKLKIKQGKLKANDDDMNNMDHAEKEQTGSTLEQMQNDGSDVAKERDSKVAPALGSKTKYVAPHLRSLVKNESEEHAKIRRRLRGLLNRLSETNVESITGEISTIFHVVCKNRVNDTSMNGQSFTYSRLTDSLGFLGDV